MKRITFFILSILCFTACNNEIIDNPGEKPEAKPQFELHIPNAEKVSVYSTAAPSECLIDSVWVLVFNSGTKELKAAEHIGGDKIVNNGAATQLMPQLSIDVALGDTVVCIANTDPNPDTSKVNLKLNTINNCFPLKKHMYYSGGEYLPMYGAMEWGPSNGYTCEMIRAVAKVQVRMGTTSGDPDVTGNFTEKNVSYKVYAYGFAGYIQPTLGTVSGIPQTTPTPGTDEYFLIQKDNATEKEMNLYLYEYPSSNRTGYNINTPIGNKDFNSTRQYIILTKDNTPNPNTYYRLDFYNAKDSTFLDTKRNHHYTFTINKVRSEGYRSISEAQNNPGSNIEYTVYIEDGSSFITSNGQYAIVTSVDTAYIESGIQTGLTIATARYQLPAKMSSISGVTTNTIAATGSLALNGGSITSLSNLNGSVIINTTTAMASGSIQGTVVFTLGNITHNLVVKVK
ncbi:MAG: hypothetical protein LBV74_02590 [Tannerella sp.]|jgi:hypothetical protein|nr:hypothetical protein [Tannerella sp.]